MRILYLDCFSGISGDMTLGALLSIGGDAAALKEQLSLLGIDDEFEIVSENVNSMGIYGISAGMCSSIRIIMSIITNMSMSIITNMTMSIIMSIITNMTMSIIMSTATRALRRYARS